MRRLLTLLTDTAWLATASLATACFGGEEAPFEAPAPADPAPTSLAAVTRADWVQRVWFVAPPGHRVEGLSIASGAHPTPMLSLADAQGRRRTLGLVAPGHGATNAAYHQAEARGRTSDVGPDGHTRVRVERREGRAALVVTSTLDPSGRGRDVLVDDAHTFHDPSLDATSTSVFVTARGAHGPGGGLLRVRLADGQVERIVPDPTAALPVRWTAPDGTAGVLYVDERPGEPVRVVFATPPPAAFGAPADWLGGATQAAWLEVRSSPGGARAAIRGCDGAPAVALTAAASGGWLLTPGGPVEIAWDCSVDPARPGCLAFGARSPSGAPVEVARVLHAGDGLTWAFSGATLFPDDARFLTDGDAADLPTLRACAPTLAPDAWIQTPRAFALPPEQLVGLQSEGGRLLAWGTRASGSRFVVQITADRVTFQTSADAGVPDPLVARAPLGGLAASIVEDRVAWTAGPPGAPTDLLPADPARRPIGIALSEDGATLLVADGDATPGLDAVSILEGAATRRVAHGPARAPAAWPVEGRIDAAFLTEVRGKPAVVTARPVRPDEAAAWRSGAATLLAHQGAWSAVAVERGVPTRCTGYDADVRAEGDTMRVRIGGADVGARAVVQDADGALRFLDAARGPTRDAGAAGLIEVAALVPTGQGPLPGRAWRWYDRTGQRPFADQPFVWYSAEEAASLPLGGPCRTLGAL
jgi:hypothetical protein